MDSVGERVRRLRVERGLTQGELATAAGVSQQAIANLENGEVQKPRFIVEIATALGVTPQRLKGGKGGAPVEIDIDLLTQCVSEARRASRDHGLDLDDRDLLIVATEMYRRAQLEKGLDFSLAARDALLRLILNNQGK